MAGRALEGAKQAWSFSPDCASAAAWVPGRLGTSAGSREGWLLFQCCLAGCSAVGAAQTGPSGGYSQGLVCGSPLVIPPVFKGELEGCWLWLRLAPAMLRGRQLGQHGSDDMLWPWAILGMQHGWVRECRELVGLRPSPHLAPAHPL